MSIWLLDGLVVLFFADQYRRDRFDRLNKLADDIERKWFPPWLQFNAIGDIASWIQHTITAALIGLLGGLLSYVLLGDFAPGFRHFSRIALAFYVVREADQLWTAFRRYGFTGLFRVQRKRMAYQRGLHVSPAVDFLMDQLGPILIAYLAGP